MFNLNHTRFGSRDLFVGLAVGFALSLGSTGFALWAKQAWRRRVAKRAEWRPIELRSGLTESHAAVMR